jgi:hypothetical protein
MSYNPYSDRREGRTLARLRLSLTIPGTARLGAYEGGALTALIVASQALGEEVLLIDSIAWASAGSINGLLTARVLLGGIDPVALFDAAWVHHVSLEDLNAGSAEMPLSLRTLTARAAGVLGPNGFPSGPVTARQGEPVRLSMALSNLDGLIHSQPGAELDRPRTMSAVPDYYSVELTNAATPGDFLALVQAASTSGSIAEAGVVDDPLGRTIDLAEDIASDDERLHLVLRPDAVALHISCIQSIYHDLERLEKTNSHVEWIERVVHGEALEELRRRQADVHSEARRIMTEWGADHSDDYAALLGSLVHSTHDPVVSTPGVDALPSPPSNPPTRDSPLHFGGLRTVKSRQSEFALGYRTMSSWLVHRLHVYLSRTDLSAALDRVNQEYARIDGRSARREHVSAPASSCRRMAELGH